MSTKLNKVAYNKIALQAEEARDIGLKSLADDVFGVIGPIAREDTITYTADQLYADVRRALWSVATDIIAYHDLTSVDIQKVNAVLDGLAVTAIGAVEEELGVVGEAGKLEPKLPGQK